MHIWRQLSNQVRWGLGVLVPILLLGFVVPLFSAYDPIRGGAEVLVAPSVTHLFGTDQLGRDVFTRTFAAAQLDVGMALAGVTIPLVVGTIVGAMTGTTRATLVSWLSQIVIEGINAFPFLVLAIAVVAIVGPGVKGLIIALAATNWARYAKIARTRALALREADFVHATWVLGYSPVRVLLRHVLPNVYSETLAYGLSDFVVVILTVAGLSYLGLGVRPPAPEWGAMMADGRLFLQRQWWLTVFPGVLLSLTAIGVALVAQGVTSWARGEE